MGKKINKSYLTGHCAYEKDSIGIIFFFLCQESLRNQFVVLIYLSSESVSFAFHLVI